MVNRDVSPYGVPLLEKESDLGTAILTSCCSIDKLNLKGCTENIEDLGAFYKSIFHKEKHLAKTHY